MAKRRGKKPYKSGHCSFSHGQYPCKGSVMNGSLITPRETLCSCSCHGPYEERLIAAGQVLAVEEDEIDDDEEAKE